MDRIAQIQQDQTAVIGHILDMIRGPAATKDMIAQNIGGQTAWAGRTTPDGPGRRAARRRWQPWP
ncbi:MAG: hypothetical protein U1E53_15835 [Dongiaceae bacterium]